MTHIFPINLSGRTLGERHRDFNAQVNEASVNFHFDVIKDLPESSPLDRLFKIDLASESKNVEFILENLKSNDMLYVSRALKSTWLLNSEYINMINPDYLESNLFKKMNTIAANKVRHWLHMHLRNEKRCQEFYIFYKIDMFHLAVKFLPNCPEEYVYNEVNSVADQLSTDDFRTLIKKYPKVAKIFFNKLGNDNNLTKLFLSKKDKYIEVVKYVLGSDEELFFDIVEKYNFFYTFKAGMTKKIMRTCRNRVISKIEFYASKLLDLKIVAQSLSVEEIKEVLLRLARAKYLGFWFCYKNVEPLIKRLSPEDRTIYRKKLFVDKSFEGDLAWPYEIPSEPEMLEKKVDEYIVDPILDPEIYVAPSDHPCSFRKLLKKRKFMKNSYALNTICNLDKLFDKYRFVNFERTFNELKTNMKIESVPKNRLEMMLVLISKSSADVKKIKKVLTILTERHGNETDNIRAAVVRGFVKRCSIWRVPEDCWQLLLEIGRNLGIDGEDSEEICVEAIHATVLRKILNNEEVLPTLFKMYCRHFSTFIDYGLTPSEKKIVIELLPKLLLNGVSDNDYGCMCIFRLFDAVEAYKIDLTKYPGAVSTIVGYCSRDKESADLILSKLYSRKASRVELIDKYFEINQNDHSFLNALRHEPYLLQDGTKLVQYLSDSDNKCPQRFLRSLILYFNETDGLADHHFSRLKNHISSTSLTTVSRSLAILSRTHFIKIVTEVNTNSLLPTKERNKIVKELYDNAHLAKVFINFEDDWKSFGVVAIANQVLICNEEQVHVYLSILKQWKETAKLALLLAERSNCLAAVFKEMADLWPHLMIKMGFIHFKKNGNAINLEMWNTLKALLSRTDVDKTRQTFQNNIVKLKRIPSPIKEEFCVQALKLNLKNVPKGWHKFILCHLNNCIPSKNDDFILEYLCGCLENEWSEHKINPELYYYEDGMHLFVNTVAKLLVMCDSEVEQHKRLESIGKVFFNQLNKFWINEKYSPLAYEILNKLLCDLVQIEVFSNSKYVSPVNCFLRIHDYIIEIFKEEKVLTSCLNLKLTILCYTSISHCLTKDPSLQMNKKLKVGDLEQIGIEFGKNIAIECDRLLARYFKSVVEIFQNVIRSYLQDNFSMKGRNVEFTSTITKGILESNCSDESKVLAVDIFQNGSHNPNSDIVKMLRKEIKKSTYAEMQFINYAIIME